MDMISEVRSRLDPHGPPPLSKHDNIGDLYSMVLSANDPQYFVVFETMATDITVDGIPACLLADVQYIPKEHTGLDEYLIAYTPGSAGDVEGEGP